MPSRPSAESSIPTRARMATACPSPARGAPRSSSRRRPPASSRSWRALRAKPAGRCFPATPASQRRPSRRLAARASARLASPTRTRSRTGSPTTAAAPPPRSRSPQARRPTCRIKYTLTCGGGTQTHACALRAALVRLLARQVAVNKTADPFYSRAGLDNLANLYGRDSYQWYQYPSGSGIVLATQRLIESAVRA
eukprot:6523533-Prymnesium_polylepis.2